jgi:2-phospho-L-lactate guanylyltransferase (CobY/MobA/RfbA family)
MTTFSIDAELERLAREAAAAEGKTLDEYVGDALRQLLFNGKAFHQSTRNGLPVVVVRSDLPAIDPQAFRRCLEEEGF